MVSLENIVSWCDQRVRRSAISDFPGAYNGLQFSNNGTVTKIGAAVDAGLIPFQKAAEAQVDFLIVHHGLFWNPLCPVTGANHQKVAQLVNNNCAVYSSHLPLDCHSEIGNNACIAEKLGLETINTFLPYEGNDIGLIARFGSSRDDLTKTLRDLFAETFVAVEYGSTHPEKVAILSGSGNSAVAQLKASGVDTLITGELNQKHFNFAQEKNLNLYCCGHYATEVFGVQALAAEVAEKFQLPWIFLPTNCPL